jgi:16S rRNA G966 N2-methylase RsmD
MFNEATRTFISQHAHEDVRRLALQGSHDPDVDLTVALQQIAGRQKAKDKFPRLFDVEHIIYPPSISIEQASSELTARYKAELLKGDSVIDLTAGFGIDSLAFAEKCRQVVAVELNEMLVHVLENNCKILHINNIEPIIENAVHYLTRDIAADTIYIDADRRDTHGRKMVDIAQCEPNVLELKDLILSKCSRLIVKLSPMIELKNSLRQLPETTEIHIVAVKNECKEILLVLDTPPLTTHPKIVAINIDKDETCQRFEFSMEEEEQTSITTATQLGNYLYEPNAALMKSGAYKLIGKRYGASPLHYHTHLYTSAAQLIEFPGRTFKIINSSSFAKKELKSLLQGISQAHVMIRNFPISADELRKKLKMQEGGELFLIGTTLFNEEKRLILARLME